MNQNRVFLWIATLLVVCGAPVLLFSDARQEQLANWFSGDWVEEPSAATAIAIVALFSGDILLPIPATAVCAVAGKAFGVFMGSALCWIGLNVSAAIGYGLARFIGWPIVRRFSDESTIADVKASVDRFGVWPLIAMRPIPVLAEASILLLGLYRYPAERFWPPILISNLVVAFVFVALGSWFADRNQFFLGVVLAALIPLVLLAIWMVVVKQKQRRENA